MIDIFYGFDDYMERTEPGWKAKRAVDRAAKARAAAAFREDVIRRYGGIDKALALTSFEQAVVDAANPFEVTVPHHYASGVFDRTTLSGWSDFDPIPDLPVTEAVRQAIKMPTTIRDAAREYDAWEARRRERESLEPDVPLPLACLLRVRIVEQLLETGLRAATLEDVLARQRYAVAQESSVPEIEKAVLADLEYLVETFAHLTSVTIMPQAAGDDLCCDFCGQGQPAGRPWHPINGSHACNPCILRWRIWSVDGGNAP